MMKRILGAIAVIAMSAFCATAYADDDDDKENSRKGGKKGNVVTIIPLGSTEGEFCATDRAMLFKDPSGVNILIQPGRTVGPGDSRLADTDVHVILLDHAHDDHIGDRIDAGECDGGAAGRTPLANADIPNIAEIAWEKGSAILVGGELVPWLSDRVLAAGVAAGTATPNVGNCGFARATTVGSGTPCVGVLRPGAVRELVLSDYGPTGVKLSTVQATHSNGISPAFIDGGDFGVGINGYGGTETGYVMRFSNGLSVYWSGDSGFFGDMKLFSEFYGVNLAIPHIGNIFTMGPDEAAFAVNKLIEPRTVIPQHANEVATSGGNVNPGTRTERFIRQVKGARVIVPLSGVPITCDGKGRCSQ